MTWFDKIKTYREFIKKNPINSKMVFIQSHDGNDLAGNMFYIAKKLLNVGKGYKIYIVLRNTEKKPVNALILEKLFSSANICYTEYGSIEHLRCYATAKYLLTDVDFIIPFEKREGQIVLQTWHGTPLKMLGFDYVYDVFHSTNQKRAFAIADYTLFPNEYTMDNMIKSYRMENVMQGKILLEGYPRNTAFFEKTDGEKQAIKEQLGIDGKEIFVYMPTWRGTVNSVSNQINELGSYLKELDSKLKDNQVLYAKLHRLSRDTIDFSEFSHIVPFPEEYETYNFLDLADCLITDYSSVMFDFLCTGKKIVLFTYDEVKYLSKQGTYISLDELPFPRVRNVSELAEELNRDKSYDDTETRRRFCPYDCAEAIDRLYETVFLNKSCCEERMPPNNGKENVLLYCGGLFSDFTTLNFMNYLDNLDLTEKNYFVTFHNTAFLKAPLRLQALPREVNLISMDHFDGSVLCLDNAGKHLLKNHPKLCQKEKEKKTFIGMLQRESERQFFDIKWSKVMKFGGIDIDSVYLMVFIDAPEKIIIEYPNMYAANKEQMKHIISLAKENGCKIVPAKFPKRYHNFDYINQV